LWQFSSDVKKAAERLDKVFSDPVVTTLAAAIECVDAGCGTPASSPDLLMAS
jgi:hypothetical protein